MSNNPQLYAICYCESRLSVVRDLFEQIMEMKKIQLRIDKNECAGLTERQIENKFIERIDVTCDNLIFLINKLKEKLIEMSIDDQLNLYNQLLRKPFDLKTIHFDPSERLMNYFEKKTRKVTREIEDYMKDLK